MSHPLTQTLELVQKAQAGDRAALDRLVERYYERVRRSVRARIGARLRAELETADILQQTFAKAWQNFDRFEMRNEGSLINWLCEYAEGQIRDQARRLRAKKRLPAGPIVRLDDHGSGPSSATLAIAGTVTGPLDGASGHESDLAIQQCMDALPDHYRMVIILRDYECLEWSEVARKLGKNTDSAARELHSRALLELTRALVARGFGPDAR